MESFASFIPPKVRANAARLLAEPANRLADPANAALPARRLVDGNEKIAPSRTRLSDAVAPGGSLDALISALKARECQPKTIDRKLAQVSVTEPVDLRVRRIEQQVRRRLDELSAVFTDNRPEARKVLEQLFPEGQVATPVEVGRSRPKKALAHRGVSVAWPRCARAGH